ncbi:MAG: hypothetical protein IKJ91_09230 [Clostridia bacterium]|nr:hypothetical protein [Clostridia bacterium]
MKKFEKRVTVYILPGDFTVEVERNGDLKDFYLVNKAYGDKMHMFSLADCYGKTEEDIIAANVEEYIEYFFERYDEN